MKQTIARHQQNYKNRRRSVEQKENAIQELEKSIGPEKEKLRFYELQIDRAIKEGKESFDEERYNVMRKAKA